MANITVQVIEGTSKKSNKRYEAIEVQIGEWRSLVFPRSKFEMDYIKQQLSENE